MEWLLSIDIGTTAMKMALVDRSGRIRQTVSYSYPSYMEGNRIEQDPELWWDAVLKGSRDLNSLLTENMPIAIILSGQMQDLIPVSLDGEHFSAILYSDTRARIQNEHYECDLGMEFLRERSANLSSPAGLPAKLLWLKENDRKTFNHCDRILLGAHDYVYWKMTGELQTDYTTASSTGLLHFDSNQWDKEILTYIGLAESRLPRLALPDHTGGSLIDTAACLLGLPSGLPVFHGSGDAATSTIGSGCGVPGRRSCYLGTSGWLAAGGSNKRADPTRGIFNLKHPDSNQCIHIGPMLTAAGNLEWIVTILSGKQSSQLTPEIWDWLTESAAQVLPGANGLFYLPHLAGERSPFLDPDARGAFIGLRRESEPGHMVRAVMEGVALSLAMIDELMPEENLDDRILQCSGGGARNSLWLRIIGASMGCKVRVSPNPETSGIIGNYLIAGKQLGWCADYSLPDFMLREEVEIPIEKEWMHVYRNLLEVYRSCYPALKTLFAKIGKNQVV
jgi:xylulokinase